jgi:hypothetical protein
VLANAPEYVASMRAEDEAIERGESLADSIAEFEAEHGTLDGPRSRDAIRDICITVSW